MGNDKFEALVKQLVAKYAAEHLDKTDGKQVTEQAAADLWNRRAGDE